MTSLSRPRRRAAAAGVAVVVALVAIVAVGRWEHNRNVAAQNARMEAVYRVATAGGIVSSRLDGYRLAWTFDCLLYHPVGKPEDSSAFELCFDPYGRLIETIDRSSDSPSFGDLHAEPSRSAVRVPVPRILAAIKALGGRKDPRLAGTGLDRTTLPVHFSDVGVASPPPPPKH